MSIAQLVSQAIHRDARCVKWSAPHFGQCRKLPADWLAAEADLISRASSPRSMVDGVATEIIEIDRTRRLAAHLGTRQVEPHSEQVRSYTWGCHGNRTWMISRSDAKSNALLTARRIGACQG
jgi:hypothetical protein